MFHFWGAVQSVLPPSRVLTFFVRFFDPMARNHSRAKPSFAHLVPQTGANQGRGAVSSGEKSRLRQREAKAKGTRCEENR